MLVVGLLAGFHAWSALKDGVVPFKGLMLISREEDPIGYWGSVLVSIVVCIVCIALSMRMIPREF